MNITKSLGMKLKNKVFDFDFKKNINFINSFLSLVWIQYIFLDRIQNLSFLSKEIYFPRGIFKYIYNESYFEIISNYSFLLIYKSLILLLLVINIYIKKVFLNFLFLILIYFYEIFKKGFGGHIDHRITTLFIFTLLLYISQLDSEKKITEIISIPYSFFFLQYSFIGIARLFNGFPEVFSSDIFLNWIIQRNMRPKYFNYDLNYLIFDTNSYIFNLLILITTLIELFSICCLFLNKKSLNIYLVCLILFHIGIFVIMGINFIENIFLLALLLYLNNESRIR